MDAREEVSADGRPTPPRTPAMRSESFDATVRDDGWYEVSSALDGEWVAIKYPVEVRE